MTTDTVKYGAAIAEGKTKTLYETGDKDLLLMTFRDDVTAFDGTKKDHLTDKGAVNNAFNAHIMKLLAAAGIPVHFKQQVDETSSLVQRLQMIPLEAVVRNRASGSLCRRLRVPDAQKLTPPIFEFFYKDDELGDPLVNESHALTFGWADQKQMQEMRTLSLAVNDILTRCFAEGGMELIDYKLEFGVHKGTLMLGDEFTPDAARIWHLQSGKKMDKDRFRQDLGYVVDSYRQAATLLGIKNLPTVAK